MEPSEPIDATVLVLEGNATCAGAFVDSEGRIATAYHCVAAGGRPRVQTRDGRHAIARVIAIDRRADLAVLSAPELAGSAWIGLRTEAPTIGEPARAIGHPYGAKLPGGFLTGLLRWSVSDGVVSGVGPTAIQTTAPVNPGNSGGPVVDGEGRLIGVVSRRLHGDGMGFAGRATELKPLLDNPNGFSGLGGTLSAMVLVDAWSGTSGTLSYGGRVEASVRDRIFVDAAYTLPASPRWDSLRYQDVSWVGPEARLGVRQRLFRGMATTTIDAWGGLVQIGHQHGEITGGDVSTDRTQELGTVVGGTLELTGVGFGFDAGLVHTPSETVWTGAFVFAWPGTFWVF